MVSGSVLGVVGCVVLADELAYVLSRDKNLHKVYILDNEAGRVLEGKLSDRRIEAELLAPLELWRASSQDSFSVLAWINPAGPHDNQAELREIVRSAAATLAPHVGLVLCFYGLCRNALWKIERLSGEVGVPMMALTDLDGKTVDDCFGANLGGKKAYLDAIVHNRGTIFVSPGYAENWQRRQSKKDIAKVVEQVENMRFVFERMNYTRVMMLENGLGDQGKFQERVDGFAKIFGLEVEERPCGMGVFEHSYSLAKRQLSALRPRSLAPPPNRSLAERARGGPLVVQR